MSKPIERRAERQNKRARTHQWDEHPEYVAMMVEFGAQYADENVPRPSQHVSHEIVSEFPTGGKGEQS